MDSNRIVPTVPAPVGRQPFEGTVVFVGEFQNIYLAQAFWIRLRVETSEGFWFCILRAPRSVVREAHRKCDIEGPAGWLMGKRISLSANLVPSTANSAFCRGVRPTKAKVMP